MAQFDALTNQLLDKAGIVFVLFIVGLLVVISVVKHFFMHR